MDKISSLVDENSLFFLISLKSCVRPISAKREEILEMIWNMEEEIMGKEN